jgi:hypothetical protein
MLVVHLGSHGSLGCETGSLSDQSLHKLGITIYPGTIHVFYPVVSHLLLPARTPLWLTLRTSPVHPIAQVSTYETETKLGSGAQKPLL